MAQRKATLLIQLKDLASGGLTKIGKSFDKLGKNINTAKIGFAVIGAGISAAGIFALKAAGQFEQWRISFTTMLGSAERSEILLEKIKRFAAETPFDLPQVVVGAKNLLAFGIQADDIIPTLKSMGDVSAGLGVDMERLILNFGQVKTQTKLTGVELRDFLRAGVPLLAELAKNLKISEAAVKDYVSAGKIGFDDVNEAFRTMTSEGGKFANLMKNQMDSLEGKFSNFGDVVFQIREAFGAILLPTAKKVIEQFILMGDKLLNLSVKSKILIIGVASLGLAVSGLVVGMAALGAIMPFIISGFAILFSPITLVTGAIIGIGLAVVAVRNNFLNLQEFMAEFFQIFTESMTLFAEGIKDILKFNFSEGIEKVKEGFTSLKDKTFSTFTSITNKVKSETKKFLDDLVNRAKNAIKIEKNFALEMELQRKEREAAEILEQQQKFQRMQDEAKARLEFAQLRVGIASVMFNQLRDVFASNSKALFLINKTAAISSAIINTLVGVTKALALGPIAGPIMAGIIKTLGFAQVAAISSQTISGLAEGGVVLPQPGGTLANIAEGGKAEAVIPLDDDRAKEKLGGALGETNIIINVGTLIADDVSVTEFAERIDEQLFQLNRNRQSVSL